MTTDFGTDISCYPDLDPSFAEISGPQVLAESTIRRWQTIRGECADDPDAGDDIRTKINRPWLRKSAYDLKLALEREAEKDERILSCSVRLELKDGSSGKEIQIDASFDTLEGPFTLTTAVSAVTSQFLGIEVTT